ncbi:MAG: hypothetical protein FWE11_06430 [Defluviitaleaceae bacterium]|nr:hypothetical protein [Defluviitaleaceae bacterium]
MEIKKFTFKTDTLLNMLFTKYPDILTRLIAEIVGVKHDDIGDCKIITTDIAPEEIGKKFCRLYINLKPKDSKVDMHVQVADCELHKHPHQNRPCEGVLEEREKWQRVIEDKDARIAELEKMIFD